MSTLNFLVTGAAGYIGSHVALQLIAEDHFVVGLDNLSNSDGQRIRGICPLVEADLNDRDAISGALQRYKIDSVIHLAALKSPEQSTQKPELYIYNNEIGTKALLEESIKQGVEIYNNVTIGLNSGVIYDIQFSGVYGGVPARMIK